MNETYRLTPDEVKELAEVGVLQPKCLAQDGQGLNGRIYVTGVRAGNWFCRVYGWWLDSDGAADIKWSDKNELESES